MHDVYDLDDEVPRCCMEGCDCGRDRELHLLMKRLYEPLALTDAELAEMRQFLDTPT